MDVLETHKHLFSDEDYALCVTLCQELKQSHIFDFWEEPGKHDESKKKLVQQLSASNAKYPGGLSSYVANAKKLLIESRDGINPYDGFVPSVPTGESVPLESGTREDFDRFVQLEKEGLLLVKDLCFVFVAGGLGERLGYSGIKLALSSNVLTDTSFFALYAENIKALQCDYEIKHSKPLEIPIAIMTSGDTHSGTVSFLKENNYFGLNKNQIDLFQQDKVPAIIDNEGRFSVMKESYSIETKPHGHGDVHSLLYYSGIAEKWVSQGKQYLGFIQDTNVLVFRGLLASLGVSKRLNLAMNSLSIPRNEGEAIGAICRLVNEELGQELTINVEYNQLDGLMKSSGVVLKKNANDKRSPLPGNLNVLLLKLQPYFKALQISKGSIPEFVNPKYADETRTKFIKPTRLECMMQDFPKLMIQKEVVAAVGQENLQVGFTQLDRFTSYSAAKNNLADAKVKFEKTGYAASLASCEADYYAYGVKILNSLGAKVASDARLVFKKSFALTLGDIIERFPTPEKITISSKSCLVISGNVTINELNLNGALTLSTEEKGKIVIKSLTVENKGIEFVDVDGTEPEEITIRGYKIQRNEVKEIIAKANEVLAI